MRRVSVDVVCDNDLVKPDQARRVTRALATQVHEHFAPQWNIDADVRFVGPPGKARKSAWQLVLLDESDKDAIDGYHELTKDGMPLGRVLLRQAMQCETGWTSTASHELLEMLANPDTQDAIFVYDDAVGARVYQCEVCDPCQDDPFCYRIDGVWVSDFVHPSWFDSWRVARGTKFDHKNRVKAPFKVAPGGYTTYYDARRRKWVDDSGTHTARDLQPILGLANRGGSRRLLRQVPRHKWRKSTR